MMKFASFETIVEQIYAVTVERRVHHPALQRILERAHKAFGQAPS